MADSGLISIGGLSKRTGCNVETIRYYEKVGLIEPPARTAGGYRQYDTRDVDRVAFIRRCRDLGFSLAKIETLLTIAGDASNHTRAEVKRLVEAHQQDIADKIRDLEQLAAALREIGEHCDGALASASECPILDALSRAAEAD